jgi:hypothetical protein
MIRTSYICLLGLLGVLIALSALQTESLTTFKFDTGSLSSNVTPQPTTCSFQDIKLPEEFVVFAAGAYSGKKTDFQIDQSGHQATQFDVAVNYDAKPVVLMLGAYEPTIWNIGWTPNTNIVAVFASGYHRQALAGLKESVPYLISTYDNKGICGSGYITPENPAAFDALARKLFNRPVETVFPASNGVVVIGSPIKPSTQLLTSSSKTIESLIDKNSPLAGPAGLKNAVAKGLLRPAVQDDIQAWIDAITAKTETKPSETATKKFNVPSNSYVVLKPFIFPSGLYGGNMATFFIPKGAAIPTGDPGHCTIFDFNTLTCTGPLCRTYNLK